jgi:hypothetical protein
LHISQKWPHFFFTMSVSQEEQRRSMSAGNKKRADGK